MNIKVLTSKIYRSSTLGKIQTKINMLGGRQKYDAVTFMNLRVFTSFILFIMVVFSGSLSFIYAPFVVAVYYVLFEYLFLDSNLKKRERKLDYEALHFFEILTLTLESGRDLESAIEITCFNTKSELSDEFEKALLLLKFGNSFV